MENLKLIIMVDTLGLMLILAIIVWELDRIEKLLSRLTSPPAGSGSGLPTTPHTRRSGESKVEKSLTGTGDR